MNAEQTLNRLGNAFVAHIQNVNKYHLIQHLVDKPDYVLDAGNVGDYLTLLALRPHIASEDWMVCSNHLRELDPSLTHRQTLELLSYFFGYFSCSAAKAGRNEFGYRSLWTDVKSVELLTRPDPNIIYLHVMWMLREYAINGRFSVTYLEDVCYLIIHLRTIHPNKRTLHYYKSIANEITQRSKNKITYRMALHLIAVHFKHANWGQLAATLG